MSKVNIAKLLENKSKPKRRKVTPLESPVSKVQELLGFDNFDCATVFISGDKESLKCPDCKSKLDIENVTKCFYNDIKVRKVAYCEDCETVFYIEGVDANAI